MTHANPTLLASPTDHPLKAVKPVPQEESFKDTCESIVVAFILAFIFRAYVVEAFVIPTGSMAPTLMGQHVRITCAQCGYTFKAEPKKTHASTTAPEPFVCPMCHYPNHARRNTPLSAGDRILVHKYIYSLHEPQRWDVLVFKAPHQPGTNYIKRLVGLPRESLWIIEGNIYVKPNRPDQDQTWHIARKPDRPKVQRAVWQPIYHSQYVPLDQGQGTSARLRNPWHLPWAPAAPEILAAPHPSQPHDTTVTPPPEAALTPTVPGHSAEDDENDWDLSQRHGYLKRSAQPGRIRFDFPTAIQGGPGLYTYNQHVAPHPESQSPPPARAILEPVEDVRVAAAFLPQQPGLAVALSTTNRLDTTDGHVVKLSAKIEPDGTAYLEVSDPTQSTVRRITDPVHVPPFPPGAARDVELWYVDQEASLWVDGRRVLQYRFDLPMGIVQSRRLPPTYPSIAIEVAGTPVTLHRVEVDRDLYYASESGTAGTLRSGLRKSKTTHAGEPVDLQADQYFCFGDNSPQSFDSRYWDKIDPWIQEQMLGGQHLPGVVPADLILGQAFFVYFPAPLRYRSFGFIPNFGELRFIH